MTVQRRGATKALMAILGLLASPLMPVVTPALAVDMVPVTVTITKVDANSDGLEGVGRGEADLYAGVRINGPIFDSFSVHQDDKDHIEPFWAFTNDVPAANVSIPVSIEIWDHDECTHPFCNDTGVFESDDDKADVDPGSDDEVNLTITLADGKWSGDVNWPANCSEGTGDSRVRVCWDISVGTGSSDSDGDGLLDGWERNGFDADSDGAIDVDLPAMGAKVDHKDLFLELDYETGQSPARADILAMKAAFAAAPLANPDGINGAVLHVDTGALVDADAREGQVPGTCSDGIDNGADGQVDGADTDCTFLDASVEDPGPTTCADGTDNDGDTLVDANDPDCLVGDNLGGGSAVTPAGACNLDSTFYAAKAVNFNAAQRRWIFRYAVSASLPGSCPSSGGWGEIGGNDFIEFNHDGGTVLHELGHTLNLRHGGFENNNCKPNYVSGMNYDNQFGINRAGGGVIIDYSPPRIALNGASRGVAPLGDLVENNLDEATILDGTDNRNRFVFVDGTGAKIQNLLNAREDWNGNGNATDAPPLTVNIDTNATGGGPSACANGATNSTLKGSNDWNRVSLPFRQFGDSADGAINPVTTPEPTLAELQDLHLDLNTTDLSVSISDAPDPVGAGEQLAYTVSVTNHGPNPATSTQVVDTLPGDVTYASDSAGCTVAAGTVTCNLGELVAGATRSVTITVDVPADLVYVNGGPKTITDSASVSNLAGPDSNTANDSDTEQTEVIAKADVKIGSVTASNVPLEVLIGQPVTVTAEVTVENGGPSSPVDTVLTGAASAPGASVTPSATSASQTALAVGTPQTVSQDFTIGCSAPGDFTWTFTYDLALANAADVDPDTSNNHGEVAFTASCVVPIAINVRPHGFPNSINLNTDATLALLTTKAGEYGLPLDFDAATVQPLSVLWGLRASLFNTTAPTGATEIHGTGHMERSYELDEKTRDADLDMVMHFKPSDSGLTVGTTEACAKGTFTVGASTYKFLGCDSVVVRP